MNEIQMINSINKNIIDKTISFKNNLLNKEDLNSFMLVNLCHMLKTTKKFTKKNKKIQNSQCKEVKASISKIKSYQGDIDYNPKELISNQDMKKIVNPTLNVYIPIADISYTTEKKFYDNILETPNFNEDILFQKEENKLEEKEQEIEMEEPPILFLKSSKNLKKNIKIEKIEKNCIIEEKKEEDDLITLFNKNDDEIFLKEKENVLNYDLMNSFFDENKDEQSNEDNGVEFKKIETLFYNDEINLSLRLSKRNSSGIYNNLSTSGSSSFVSADGYKSSLGKDLYENEFQNLISYDFFKKCCEQMSVEYLRYMKVIYSNSFDESKFYFYVENKMFINLVKAFILKSGISTKSLYDKLIKVLTTKEKNNNEIISFESFLKCFSEILKVKKDKSILKYKFIISIFRLQEKEMDFKQFNIFMQIMKGKLVYEAEIWDELNRNFMKRYDKFFSSDIGTTFRFEKILLCLESFYDKSFVGLFKEKQ